MDVRTGMTRRALIARIAIGVAAAVAMLAGSYVLVGWGDRFAVGGLGVPQKRTDEAPSGAAESTGTVVSRIRNTADLPAGTMVITVPLGTKFETPGSLYGVKAKKPIALGPASTRGMTQDGFSGQAGLMLPDGRQVLYHFWQQLTTFPSEAPGDPVVPDGTHMSTPTIRLVDTASGQDRLVVTGARSMAVRADGAFACTEGVDADYRYNVTYMRRVVVRPTLDADPVVWTSDADQYTVLQWAGDALFVFRETLGGGGDVLAFTGPDACTRIVPEGQTYLGLSPDGAHILTFSGGFAGSDEPLVLHRIDWRSGAEVATLSLGDVLDPATGEPVSAMPVASWEGERVAVGLNPAHLALVGTAGSLLTLEDVVTFQYPNVRPGVLHDIMLDEAGSAVSLVASEGPRTVELERTSVITYDLVSGECSRWISPGAPAVTRFVRNPSRPR